MTQYVINIGTLPNDGTGDPLRTAFNEVNLNFDQVFAAGPVLSNIRIANNTILTTNTNGNLVLAPNGIGVVQANVNIVPNTGNIKNLGSPTRRWSTVYAQYLDIAGNLTIGKDLTIGGNLTVNGNVTSINTTNLDVEDKVITIAYGSANAAVSDGAGILVAGSNASILYDNANSTWDMNIGLAVNGNISGTGLEVSDATVYSNVNAVNGNYTGNIVVDTVLVRTIKLNPNSSPNVNVLPNITVVDNTVFESNVDIDGTLFVMGSVDADSYVGDGSQLTGIVTWTTVPGSNTAPGIPGQAAYDSGGNLYVCVSANVWSKFSGTVSW